MSERSSSNNKSLPKSGRATRAAQHAQHSAEEMRLRLAREAARIMAESGMRDFALAKRKAAERLSALETKNLPSNEEVEQELRRYLELFQGKQLPRRLAHLRAVALEAMRFLEQFQPRLVGALLTDVVTDGTIVELHLSAETPEQIGWWLDEHRIPWVQGERRLRFGGDRHEPVPAYRFTADDVDVELCVFDHASARETPLSPVDGRPMRRANIREVEMLVNQTPGTASV